MKKTKLKHRIDNAVNAFFDNNREIYVENNLTFASDSALLKQETAARFNEKADVLVKILKRTFLFLPGAFYLFYGMLLVFTFDFFWNPLTVITVFLVGGFMTIFGIGNLKNPKHLVIPLSICAVGVAVFALFSVFGNAKFVFEYGTYFFPLALIAPFLVKNLVDKTDKVHN